MCRAHCRHRPAPSRADPIRSRSAPDPNPDPDHRRPRSQAVSARPRRPLAGAGRVERFAAGRVNYSPGRSADRRTKGRSMQIPLRSFRRRPSGFECTLSSGCQSARAAGAPRPALNRLIVIIIIIHRRRCRPAPRPRNGRFAGRRDANDLAERHLSSRLQLADHLGRIWRNISPILTATSGRLSSAAFVASSSFSSSQSLFCSTCQSKV